MKKTLLVVAIALLTHRSDAQTATNTYPLNGDVGVGTTSPLTRLHVAGNGASVDGGNSNVINGDGLAVQGLTGGRSTTIGAQLEFIIPANTDGTSPWGQGRIITIAGNSNSSDATGKMILGTRRSFNKLGTGVQWYYGNDLIIDGSGNIGVGTTSPSESLDVNGNPVFGTLTERLSMGSGSLGFNRRVSTGTIYDNTKFSYQFQHTGSSTSTADYLALQVYNPGSSNVTPNALIVNGAAQVGINTTYVPSAYQLAVNGSVIATSITVQLRSSWPDYVFNKNYQIPSLADVNAYIDKNHHLPEIPSEDEVKKDGLNLGEMNKLLLKKVEELTLYLIDRDKAEKEQKALSVGLLLQLKSQQNQINELTHQLNDLITSKKK